MPTHSIQPPGAGTPAPGFDEPFDMLRACHERVHRMLALLERLGRHVDANGADEQARQAARDVMRYFDLAAPQHHLDEERHVIPRLAAAGDPALAALAARLQDEHRAMSEGWARVRPLLLSLAEGERTGFDTEAHRAFQDYARLYASHIEAEESAAFPAAEAGMDGTALQAMSQDMAGRRGVG
ncbi:MULTISPECIES: hemerythrin domain-containing protein [Ramlibacter]|uniref:Hemerythrin domain-containing protein n=1 Tax=Ramlibacter pinisoli TaxID=2682844 RepID=A0A6N8J0R7_9BURK|nr:MULTISPECIES: hemerythrin domain-containing protein [Ramlibacter]MBA2961910.1 hemerythrin domain-containing protein [Ramlibacter sp. CGMCC 1.13660]MVQ31853.1 hemerythrin domain-containing protein [Ramlibacter pinisoli]